MFITVGLYGAIDCSWGAQEAALERARRQAFQGAEGPKFTAANFSPQKKWGSWSKKSWKIVKVEIQSTKSCEQWGFKWFNPEKPGEQ